MVPLVPAAQGSGPNHNSPRNFRGRRREKDSPCSPVGCSGLKRGEHIMSSPWLRRPRAGKHKSPRTPLGCGGLGGGKSHELRMGVTAQGAHKTQNTCDVRMAVKRDAKSHGCGGPGRKQDVRKLRSGCDGSGRRKIETSLKLRSGIAGAGGREKETSFALPSCNAGAEGRKKETSLKLRRGCAGAGGQK